MNGRTRGPRPGRVALLVAALLGMPCGLAGQLREAVTIDFVSPDGVYLTAGSVAGLVLGDTITLFADPSSATVTVRLELVSVTRRRSVGSVLDGSPPSVGTIAYINTRAVTAETPTRALPTSTDRVARRPPPRGASTTPRITGYASASLDARRSEISWSGDLAGSQVRDFATPVARLSMTVSELPGHLTLRTQLRASWRYDGSENLTPATSIRAYDFSIGRRFERVPVDVRIGRFYNPYEAYSSFWDGLLLRLGSRRGSGVGMALGYEPTTGNEGVSTDVSKLTVFGTLVVNRAGWRYSSEVSGHRRISDAGARALLTAETFLGWSQRLNKGRLSLSQRLQLDRDPASGEWTIRRLRLRGSLGVTRSLELSSGYTRAVPNLRPIGAPLAPVRREVWAGATTRGPVGDVSVTVGRTTWDGGREALSVSGSSRITLSRFGLYLSGQRWGQGGATTTSVSPGLGLTLDSFRSMITYRRLTGSSAGASGTHSIDVTISGVQLQGSRLTIGAARQWGSYLSGTRIRALLSRSL